jgi:hypothetical protein
MRAAPALAIALLLAAPAGAQTAGGSGEIVTNAETVRDLALICDPPWSGVPRLEAIAYCQGFVTAAGQYHALLYPQGGPARPLFCLPTPGPTIAESGVAFAAWARQQPRFAQEPALDGFLRWAQESFPCPPAGARRRAR